MDSEQNLISSVPYFVAYVHSIQLLRIHDHIILESNIGYLSLRLLCRCTDHLRHLLAVSFGIDVARRIRCFPNI